MLPQVHYVSDHWQAFKLAQRSFYTEVCLIQSGFKEDQFLTVAKQTLEFQYNKRRKVEKIKRESFNGSYTQIASWAEHILSRLENGLSGNLDVEDQRFLHEETEAEVGGELGEYF